MNLKLNTFFLACAVIVLLVASIIPVNLAFAADCNGQPCDGTCVGPEGPPGGPYTYRCEANPPAPQPAGACDNAPGNPDVARITTKIRDTLLTIGILLTVVGFVVAGIIYLTAAGGERMNLGKKAFIGGVIGAFLVALAATAGVVIGIFCWFIA